jgi:hypothetical protein
VTSCSSKKFQPCYLHFIPINTEVVQL